MKKLLVMILLLMTNMVVSADELVKFDTNKFTGGKVEKASEAVLPQEKEEDPVYVQVTITVTPDPGYYITKEDIVVMATYPLPETPAVKTRTEGEEEKKPEFANQIELVGDDPLELTEKRDYSFTIEKGFGVWVTEANFKQAATEGKVGEVSWSLKAVESKGGEGPKLILTLEGEGAASLGEGSAPWSMQKSAITNLVVSKGITAFGAGLLSGCDHLSSVEIQNDKSVITLGEGAIPANEGLAIDVPGNIFNKYQMNDGWKGFKVDSENAEKMENVKFVKDKNQFDVYVASKNLKLPVGVSGYDITGVQGDKILYKEVDVITAGKPLLLFSDQIISDDLRTVVNPTQNKTREGAGEEVPVVDFALKVVTAKDPEKPIEEQGLDVKLGQVYMLYNDVFYPTQAGRIPVGGIYLEEVKKEGQSRSFARLYLTLDGAADADDAITAIDNSPLSIVHCPLSTSWYDLRGRRLNGRPTAKGVYINNGKKYVVK